MICPAPEHGFLPAPGCCRVQSARSLSEDGIRHSRRTCRPTTSHIYDSNIGENLLHPLRRIGEVFWLACLCTNLTVVVKKFLRYKAPTERVNQSPIGGRVLSCPQHVFEQFSWTNVSDQYYWSDIRTNAISWVVTPWGLGQGKTCQWQGAICG